MIPALTLALALVGQTATTQVNTVAGTADFTLSWGADGNLWLELDNVQASSVNGVTATDVDAAFAPINLSLNEADQETCPYRVQLSTATGDALLAYRYVNTEIYPGSASIQFAFAQFAVLGNSAAPYSFAAFNYGAFEYINLVPASGKGADVAAVQAGKLFGVSGTVAWSLSLSPLNPVLNPRQAPEGMYRAAKLFPL